MKWLIRLFLFSIVLLILCAVPLYYVYYTDRTTADVTVIIPEKSSTAKVVEILKQNSVISNDTPFKIIAYVNAKNGRYIQPGEYFFEQGTNSKNVLKKILKGERIVHKLTIPEGFTNYQISKLLEEEKILKGDAKLVGKEGSYMPETYVYYYDTNRKVIIDKMESSMSEFLKANLSGRDVSEVMILASIVEKEAKMPEERPLVASVYLNRIAKKMPLQADPTVIYALKNGQTDFNYILTKEDLKYDSPFNTYVYPTLPPSPICNPGKASIKAVLNPAKTDYLYFVADGTSGKHIFATDYKEHLANIAKVKAENK